jgi:hypothetical protein
MQAMWFPQAQYTVANRSGKCPTLERSTKKTPAPSAVAAGNMASWSPALAQLHKTANQYATKQSNAAAAAPASKDASQSC